MAHNIFILPNNLTLGAIHDLAKKNDLIEYLSAIDEAGSTCVKQSLSAVLSADEKSQSNIISDFINRLNLGYVKIESQPRLF